MDDKLRSRVMKSANDIRKGGFINPAFVNDEYASKGLEEDKAILGSGSGVKSDIIITDPETGEETNYSDNERRKIINNAKDRVASINVGMDKIHRALTVEGVLNKIRERLKDPNVINDPEKFQEYSKLLGKGITVEDEQGKFKNMSNGYNSANPYGVIGLTRDKSGNIVPNEIAKKPTTRISDILGTSTVKGVELRPGHEGEAVTDGLAKERSEFERMYRRGVKERSKSISQASEDFDKKVRELAASLEMEPYISVKRKMPDGTEYSDVTVNPKIKEILHGNNLDRIGGLTLGDQSVPQITNLRDITTLDPPIFALASRLKSGTMRERIEQAIRAYAAWDRANDLEKFGIKPIPDRKRHLDTDFETLSELATSTNAKFTPGYPKGRKETFADQIHANNPIPGIERLKGERALPYDISNVAQNVKDWSGWRKVQDGDNVRSIRNGIEAIPIDGEMMKWVYHPDWKNDEYWHKYGLRLASRIRPRLINTHEIEESIGNIETEQAVRKPEFRIKPGTDKPYREGDPIPFGMIVRDGQIGEREKIPNVGRPLQWAYNPSSKVLGEYVDTKGDYFLDIGDLKSALIKLMTTKKQHSAASLDSIGAITGHKQYLDRKKEPVKNPILSIIGGEKPIIETPKNAKSKTFKEEVNEKRKSKERKKATYVGELKSKYPEMGEDEKKKDTEESKKSLSIPFKSILEFRKNNPNTHIMDITKSLERKICVKNKILKSISMIKKAEDGPMGSEKIVFGNQQSEAPPKEDSYDPDEENIIYGQNEKGEDLDANGNVMSKQKEIDVGDYYTGDNQESKEVHDYLNKENIKLQTDKNRQSMNASFDPQLYDRPLDVSKIISMSKPTKESLQAEYDEMKEKYPEQFKDGRDLIDNFILSDVGKELLLKSRYKINGDEYTLNGFKIPYDDVKKEMIKGIKNIPELTNLFNTWVSANTTVEPIIEETEEVPTNPEDIDFSEFTPEEIELAKLESGADDTLANENNNGEDDEGEGEGEDDEGEGEGEGKKEPQQDSVEKLPNLIDTEDILNLFG